MMPLVVEMCKPFVEKEENGWVELSLLDNS
jgi:hypothetical protein